jgi:carbamate kinase
MPKVTAANNDENARPAAPATAVVALGGHAFTQHGERGTHDDQLRNARMICEQLMTLVERDYRLVITHGNGPQVGALLNQNEQCRELVPAKPLDVLVAQTEGGLGYYLQQELLNSLRRRGRQRYVVTVVTQVVVDPDDPAFQTPTKPVGPFLDGETAQHRAHEEGWVVGEDAGRGWRRLVASPAPEKVIQRNMIAEAAAQGHIVVAAGGGGIPVVRDERDDYVGVEAVIDKDSTSSLLAQEIGADLLLILTHVDRVYLNYQKPDESPLGAVTLAECARYIEEGHFPPGSMGPKVSAVYDYLIHGGRRGLITSPEQLAMALDGGTGTHFVGRI